MSANECRLERSVRGFRSFAALAQCPQHVEGPVASLFASLSVLASEPLHLSRAVSAALNRSPARQSRATH